LVLNETKVQTVYNPTI